MDLDGNYVEPSEDQSLRISIENLRLRDNCQREEPIRGSYPVSFRGQNSQLVDVQLNQAKDVLEKLEVHAAHPEEAGSTDKQRKITGKGRKCRK